MGKSQSKHNLPPADPDVSSLELGTPECALYPEGEAAIDDAWSTCLKHPGHVDFIPVTKFKLKNIPKCKFRREIFDVIKAMSSVTVRISLRRVSPARPDVIPDTTIPYFLSNFRGRNCLRFGSGVVREVRIFQNDQQTCTCVECENSQSPAAEWGQIFVNSATHVVFDNDETRDVKVFFFQDDDLNERPELTVTAVEQKWSEVKDDRCQIICTSHNMKLLKDVQTKVKVYTDLYKQLVLRHQDVAGENKLAAVVSHPHGNVKHVSVGQWTRKMEVGSTGVKYWYNTCTCQGSSGGPVFVLGREGGVRYNHPHSGSKAKSNNYSGIWLY